MQNTEASFLVLCILHSLHTLYNIAFLPFSHQLWRFHIDLLGILLDSPIFSMEAWSSVPKGVQTELSAIFAQSVVVFREICFATVNVYRTVEVGYHMD